MKKEIVIQQGLWWVFVLYYAGTKYLAGYQGWNLGYAIQVGLIVTLTSLIPYYLTATMVKVFNPSRRIVALVLMPVMLALSGYAAFYLVFIQPNFPNVTMSQVVPRGIFPGVIISALLLLPDVVHWWRLRRSTPAGNSLT